MAGFGRVVSDALDALPAGDRDLVDRWLHGRPHSTAQVYDRELGAFFAFCGCRRIADVTPEDVRAYSILLASEQAPATARRRFAVVRSFFGYADRERSFGANPAIAVEAPGSPPERADTSVDESVILAALKRATGRDRALLTLAYVTGASTREILAFRWADFAFDPSVDGGRAVVTLRPHLFANGQGVRSVVISRSAAQPLEAWRLATVRYQLVDGRSIPPFKLTSERGIDYALRNAGARVGLPNLTAGKLRASHGAHAIAHGCPLHVVARTLGRTGPPWSPEMSRSASASSALYLRV